MASSAAGLAAIMVISAGFAVVGMDVYRDEEAPVAQTRSGRESGSQVVAAEMRRRHRRPRPRSNSEGERPPIRGVSRPRSPRP